MEERRSTQGLPLAVTLALVALCGLFVHCSGWSNPDVGRSRSQGPVEPSCGDQACTDGETCGSCPSDCGACPAAGPSCGDGACNGQEDCMKCPTDCLCDGGRPSATCGNARCDPGETCTSCQADCGVCPLNTQCGDGMCSGAETCGTCPADCGACPPPCPTNGGPISVEEIAVRDDASGRYLMGIKLNPTGGTTTVSGLRLVDGTVRNNHVVIHDEFVYLPGKPACPIIPTVMTRNCRCDFPLVVANGANRCTVASITNCNMCGAMNPMDHDTSLGCTTMPPVSDGGF